MIGSIYNSWNGLFILLNLFGNIWSIFCVNLSVMNFYKWNVDFGMGPGWNCSNFEHHLLYVQKVSSACEISMLFLAMQASVIEAYVYQLEIIKCVLAINTGALLEWTTRLFSHNIQMLNFKDVRQALKNKNNANAHLTAC